MPFSDMPINVTDTSFENAVLQAPLPVVAVFWSPQETPREPLNALLGEVAKSYAGQVTVAKLDVADAPQARALYGVQRLPEFLFWRAGRLVARAKGMPSSHALKPWLEYLLGRGPSPAAAPRPPQEAPAHGAAHGAAGGAQPMIVTDADFDQTVLQAKMPVMVDCWAAWCGPCRAVAPAVEALAREFAGRARVAKLDVDANPATASRYGVRSIPTLLFFVSGREVDRAIGAQPIDVLRSKLSHLL